MTEEITNYIQNSVSCLEKQAENMGAKKGDTMIIGWSKEKGIHVKSITTDTQEK